MTNLPEVLFLQLKRWKTTKGKISKYLNKIEIDKQIKVQGQDYSIAGWTSHIGRTLDSGHHHAVIKRSGKFIVLDDDKKPFELEKKTNREQQSVYLLSYTKENGGANNKGPSDISTFLKTSSATPASPKKILNKTGKLLT